jgi:hypothetical protein
MGSVESAASQKHLIRPLTAAEGPVDAPAYLDQLQGAHDAIVDRAIGWTNAAAGSSWGIRAKRAVVDLAGAHPMVTSEKHPILELLNICATVERLVGALRWAIDRGWAQSVLECSPTTSGVAGPSDVRTVGGEGEAWFEVSDVLSARDGRRKLRTDLERLERAPAGVATFLVTSPSWERRIQVQGFSYAKVPPEDTIVARVIHAP